MEKKIKICACVTGKNLKEFLKNLEEISKISNLLELRVDYIENLNEENLEQISNKLKEIENKTNRKIETIFTCRSQKEGGKFPAEKEGEDEKRFMKINKYVIQSGYFDIVDIEISKLNDFKEIEKPKNTKIIGSYHNFKETLKKEKLNKIIDALTKYNFVNIAKIATKTTTDKDVINLMNLFINKKTEKELIIIGMGIKGQITRILTGLWGYLTFASTTQGNTAPGQFKYNKLIEIYDKINPEEFNKRFKKENFNLNEIKKFLKLEKEKYRSI